jgi:type IV secretory pathway TrbF-like protein
MQTEIIETSAETEARRKSAQFRGNFYDQVATTKKALRRRDVTNFILLAVSIFLGYTLFTRMQTSKTELYVVERTGPGQYEYRGNVKAVDPTKLGDFQDHVVEELKKGIVYWREVTSDETAAKRNWNRAFLFVVRGTQAQQQLSDWYDTRDEKGNAINDPISRGQKGQTVAVHFTNWLPDGDNTWEIEWEESTTASPGQPPTTKLWKARITYMIAPSDKLSDAIKDVNPFGIMGTELRFNEMQVSQKGGTN